MAFRFDAASHEYVDLGTGEIVAHITDMLERTGWSCPGFYTEEARIRGRAVHRLTADYDLGALEDVDGCVSPYRGYLLAHVKAMSVIQHEWLAIEEAVVNAVHRFGGRPDRVGIVYGARAVLEVKTGPAERGHPIQTALQAVLVAEGLGLPAESIQRYALYLKPSGKFKLDHFVARSDFDEAYRIIRRCAA